MRRGSHTFKYRVTAPHKGTFKVYVTKSGYDPAKPLAWSDLDLANPVATATDPAATGGFYTFSGTPARALRQAAAVRGLAAVGQPGGVLLLLGRHLRRRRQRGRRHRARPRRASAPAKEQIDAGNDKSTVEHHGHGDNDPSTSAEPAAAPESTAPNRPKAAAVAPNQPKAAGATENLAETGGDSSTTYLAIGGAAALALGSSALFLSARRRAASGGRHGR